MHPPAWEILCGWIKLEAGEGTGPQDPLAQQKKGVRCDPSELLLFSDIAAMKTLPHTSAMGGDVRMDRPLERHIALGRPGEALQERGRPKAGSELIKRAALEVITRDVLGLLLRGWCCRKQD